MDQITSLWTFRDIRLLIYSLSIALATAATVISLEHNVIVAYGDAESHLNIAKRVLASPTSGFSQLGGIWLPLPHLLMVPLVYFDPLWRSGLAGSVVSGIAYVVACIALFQLTMNTTKRLTAAVTAWLVFALNPNILYMQATPMTELPLIAFFVLSVFFFTEFLGRQTDFRPLILAAIFAFAASLSRYDGWLLVAGEAGILGTMYLMRPRERKHWEGYIILFSTVAFFGILLWLLWDYLILGDAMYFTNSPFSAKSQQQGWLARGELPSYRNPYLAVMYYLVTARENIGLLVSGLSVAGLLLFFFRPNIRKIWVTLLLLFPLFFYIITLYSGQSIIFIPELTPDTYEFSLFNVRYGIMMVPAAAFFTAICVYYMPGIIRPSVVAVALFSFLPYALGRTPITLADGTVGLSSAKTPDVQHWLSTQYDHGYILLDDYSRTVSIIKSGLPMEQVIYIGNKPYWEESLDSPEKYARWIVMQKNDALWKNILDRPEIQARLYQYFEKAYTSPDILVFKRKTPVQSSM